MFSKAGIQWSPTHLKVCPEESPIIVRESRHLSYDGVIVTIHIITISNIVLCMTLYPESKHSHHSPLRCIRHDFSSTVNSTRVPPPRMNVESLFEQNISITLYLSKSTIAPY
jgi:hypothetical protein